jgi:hypothetical protein
MADLDDKISEIGSLMKTYKSKRDAEHVKNQEKSDKIKAEIKECFSEIGKVEQAFFEIDFEIEDDEPFFHDRRKAHPEMGFRWILVRKAKDEQLFVRKYSGESGRNMIEEIKPTDEYPLHLLKAICDRLPAFVEVVTNRVKDTLK